MEVSEAKDGIQRHAHDVWTAMGRRGTIAAGTGAGKSRIAVMECDKMMKQLGVTNNILLVTPTEKLRDENWPSEFRQWSEYLFESYSNLKMICFASLKNYKASDYDLVILDEAHKLTDNNSVGLQQDLEDFFSYNTSYTAVMGLTATMPDEKREAEKYQLLKQIAPIVYRYTLDQGIEDGLIADYEIRVILHELDDNNKIIKAGTIKKPFMTTEKKHYEYLEKQLKKMYMIASELHKLPAQTPATVKALANIQTRIQLATFARNRFLYTLPSKTALARRCIKHMAMGKRTLVLGGGIAQIEELLPGKTFHSKTDDKAYQLFNSKQIEILGAVQALDEGVNIVDLDQMLIVSFDSSNRRMVQRIGRNLRLRTNHKGMVYILQTEKTQEDRWLEKGLDGFDENKIKYFSAKNVPL